LLAARPARDVAVTRSAECPPGARHKAVVTSAPSGGSRSDPRAVPEEGRDRFVSKVSDPAGTNRQQRLATVAAMDSSAPRP
jgi:hypothetical protein